jgi:cyclopropane fatty-acyl-phospholipid synthase-like methyltransferase
MKYAKIVIMQSTEKPKIADELYQKNVEFWETAWSRVKKASTTIPDVIDYIPRIPGVFQENGCKNILDIACGSGWLCFFLQEHGFQVTGVDISPSAIKLANEVKDERKLTDNQINFVLADMTRLELPSGIEFDGLLVNAAFEHLDFQRGKNFLHEIKNFIAKDGIMFGVFDKVGTGKKGEYELLADGSQQYLDTFRAGMLLRNYSDDELKEILESANWEILSWDTNNFESRIIVAKNKK